MSKCPFGTWVQVLWPNSGWCSVPLTSLIESSHVKKAYQKARLCLHPDKLQQRGATAQQKYVAEKVFSVLQVHLALCPAFFPKLTKVSSREVYGISETTIENFALCVLFDCRMHGPHLSRKMFSFSEEFCSFW